MDKKVSVAVTCYNHENFIEECLRSIFAQTHQNIELLVFNDAVSYTHLRAHET